jgi:hypothetical protein
MTESMIRKLGNGLILRHGTPTDEEALVKFNREIHGEGEWGEKGLEDWTRDLISGEMPTFQPSDFTVVEDTSTGEIVSICCHISQTWSYEGIPFKVGRPELVGTKKDYRRRGLVRQQFEILHEWSAERGELVQVITGIPYYYRQFGYEMTLNLDSGHAGYEIHVPELKEDEKEIFSFRLATEADIPFLMATYEFGCQRQMVYSVWNEDLWRYELTGKRKYNINRREIYLIEDQDGEQAGFIGIPPVKWGHSMMLTIYELAPGFSWTAITPSVICFLWQKGEELAKEQDQTQKIFGFWLGEEHPAYQVAATNLPRERKPYTYYVRVPDLPAFLLKIQSILEARLASSAFANTTKELKLSFYKDGLSLSMKNGRIETIKKLDFDELEDCNAHFPPLVFLHLVFGHRSVAELNHAFTDCAAKDEENANLLDALFPKKPSHVWAVS